MAARRRTVWLERVLTIIGFACLGWYAYAKLDATFYQREQEAAFERRRQAQPSADAALEGGIATDAVLPSRPLGKVEDSGRDSDAGERSESGEIPLDPSLERIRPVLGDVIGMLNIPRLSMSTPIVVGDDDRTLRGAAGLLPDTAHPWNRGNAAIAGHRDGLFRPLKHIRIGDEVVLRTTRGDLRYRVRDTKIVMPDDLSVLAPTETQTLTLITCYPFSYIGSAPKRFIVHADRVIESAFQYLLPPAIRPQRPDTPTSAPVTRVVRTAVAGPRRVANRAAVSRRSPVQDVAIERVATATVESVPERKAGNRFLRGLRAFGRAFKPQASAKKRGRV